MYLNIINNIRHEGKKKVKLDYSFEKEKNDLENNSVHLPMIMIAGLLFSLLWKSN